MVAGINWGKYPVLLVGAAEDLTTWTQVGTWVNPPTASSNPFGDANDAYRVVPGGSGTVRYIQSPPLLLGIQDPTSLTVVWIMQRLFPPHSGGSVVSWYDTTFAVTRKAMLIDWSSPAPVVSSLFGLGSTFDQVIDLGPSISGVSNRWYAFIFRVNNITFTNGNVLRLYPSATSESDTTGTVMGVMAYLRSTVFPQWPFDRTKAYPRPREGSEFIKGSSGVEDAWIVGPVGGDQYLETSIRYISAIDEIVPRFGTGWEGTSPSTTIPGVGCGWRKLLELGRNKNLIRVSPDRTEMTRQQSGGGWADCYLDGPMTEDPDSESDGLRSLPLLLRTNNGYPIIGY